MLALFGGLLAACSGPQSTDTTTQPESIASEELPMPEDLEWTLAQLNGAVASLTNQDIEARFAPDFIDAVGGSAEMVQAIVGVAASGPYELYSFETTEEDQVLRAVVRSSAGDWMGLVIVWNADGLMQGWGMFGDQTLNPDWAPPENWDAVRQPLEELAETVSIYSAEVVDGICTPVFDSNGDRLLGVGSAFKLYVVSALVSAVERGDVAWDDVFAIQEELKSLPTGNLHLEAAGTEISYLDAATLMISISDNTATDHLISILSREAVEDAVAAGGHHDPSALTPFLLTADLFVLKILTTPTDLAEYMAADEPTQRALLEELELDWPTAALGASFWSGPRHLELEWLASGHDLCNVMAHLHELGRTEAGDPVGGILSANPGTRFDRDTWTWVGYKGGSEPGVLNFTWLLERADGRLFVLTVTFNDTEHDIDLEAAIGIIQDAPYLLADVP